MKTVKPVHGGLPERVKDPRAKELVESGKYVYCGKIEWKTSVRDASKKPAKEAVKAEPEAPAAANADVKKTRAETKAQALAAKKARIAEVNRKIVEEHKKTKSS
jgi:hypothetical protein